MHHLRRHVALTVWPIGLLFAIEIGLLWPALAGASSYAAASPMSWLSLAVSSIVIAIFLAVYVQSWRRLAVALQHDPGPYRTRGCVRLQKLAGGLSWAFAVSWLVLRWRMTLHAGPVALSHYEILRRLLSQPWIMGLVVLGLAAVGLYLAQGIAASFRTWGIGRGPKSSRRLEAGCTLVAALMTLLAINLLSHFTTGRAYWSISTSTSTDRVTEGAPR